MEKEDGVWRTIRGRRIFIRDGESLGSAMSRSGKFKREDIREGKHQARLDTALDKNKYASESKRHKIAEKYHKKEASKEEYNYRYKHNANNQAEKNRINENAQRESGTGDRRVDRNWNKYSKTDQRELRHEHIQKKLVDYKAKKQSNNKVDDNYYKGTKRQGFGYANDDNIPVYDNKIDYSGDFTHANLSKVSDDDLKKIINKQTELYNEATNRRVGDRRTYNGKKDQLFKDVETLRYSNGMKVAKEEAIRRENEKRPQYKGTDYEVKYYSVADALNDPNSKIRQFIDKKRSNRKNKGK